MHNSTDLSDSVFRPSEVCSLIVTKKRTKSALLRVFFRTQLDTNSDYGQWKDQLASPDVRGRVVIEHAVAGVEMLRPLRPTFLEVPFVGCGF